MWEFYYWQSKLVSKLGTQTAFFIDAEAVKSGIKGETKGATENNKSVGESGTKTAYENNIKSEYKGGYKSGTEKSINICIGVSLYFSITYWKVCDLNTKKLAILGGENCPFLLLIRWKRWNSNNYNHLNRQLFPKFTLSE